MAVDTFQNVLAED